MRDIDAQRIRTLALFASMSVEHFGSLTANAFMQKFPAGTNLLYEGDTVDFLYVLMDGSVELQGGWNGKESTVSVITPLSLFILSSVVLDASALVSARTLERSEILLLSAQSVRRAMREDHAFALAVSQELAGWHRTYLRIIKNQKLRTGAERLANYLLTQQIKQNGVNPLTLPHEKRILASLLGMTPENLSRAFMALANYGVEVSGNEVKLTMVTALNRMAKPTPLIDNQMPPLDHLVGKAESELWPPLEHERNVDMG